MGLRRENGKCTLALPFLAILTRVRLATVNALPPNLIYKSASATAEELVPKLRQQGCELIIALTHQREPNDNKLAEKTSPGLIDLILGGHDHYYNHSLIKSTHILRSGTDFRQLSYIEAWRKDNGGWDVNITRRDIVRSLPEDTETLKLVGKLTDSLKTKLEKPIGYTCTPLDARFSTVRTRESNLGNFVCDLMRFYYRADCAIMAAGTIRGDQVYPPGVLRIKDIMNCFPFEDPVVVLKVPGKGLHAALENSVSLIPALEGRYPQVSNINFEYNPELPSGSRVQKIKVHGQDLDDERMYILATRGYMARGKDGFDSLLVKSEGGEVEEVVSEENGMLISTILRQYFLSLKIMGKWSRWSANLNNHWNQVHSDLHQNGHVKEPTKSNNNIPRPPKHSRTGSLKPTKPSTSSNPKTVDDSIDSDSDNSEDEIDHTLSPLSTGIQGNKEGPQDLDRNFRLARAVAKKWMRLAKMTERSLVVDDAAEEFTPAWTKGIAPRLEGRIKILSSSKVDG